MKYLLLSETTIGPKEIAVGFVQLGNKIVAETSQSIAYIDRQGHSDQDFPFVSCSSGNEMTVDFGSKVDENIGINPLQPIRIPRPHITSTSLSNCEIFGLVIRVSLWHGTVKN